LCWRRQVLGRRPMPASWPMFRRYHAGTLKTSPQPALTRLGPLEHKVKETPVSTRTNAGMRAAPPGHTTADAGEPGPAAPRRLGFALIVIATAQLMVVLDATIVNVALPHIQRALGFSGTGLEWVVNAYALTFGGLLLLGGRAGDLLGKRKMFVVGVLLFSAASLAGGFATTQAWLLTARALQGAGAAIIAPTALSLVSTTFPEGPPRNRAMSVYAAMSVTGGVVGLIAGGLLTTYASWRWVLFVNVPIGLTVAFAAARVLGETKRRHGRFDLPGAITATGGLAALVYGLSNAATTPNGVSHWGDAKVVASLAAATVLLVTFAFIQTRSRQSLLPPRILASRDRAGAYLMMLCIGTALFSVLFFLTIFVQTVWGFSALKSGVAYLPMMAAIMAMSGASAQLVPRIGALPLLIVGATTVACGLFWLSRISEHSDYVTGLLGPTLIAGTGFGMLFMPLALVSLSHVRDTDSGVASSLLNTGQQVGGSIGLAVLGTVAWTAVAGSIRSQAAAVRGSRVHAAAGGMPAAVYQHALATGFSRAFEVSVGIMLLALAVAVVGIRVHRTDEEGAQSDDYGTS
jgi:EmrB/QacA subfamily drug resistance transporter